MVEARCGASRLADQFAVDDFVRLFEATRAHQDEVGGEVVAGEGDDELAPVAGRASVVVDDGEGADEGGVVLVVVADVRL